MKDLTKIKNYVKDFMNHKGHSYSHILRVYKLCKKIINKNNSIDESILLPAVLLHDIARSYELSGEKICHAEKGAEMAKKYLTSLNYDAKKIEKIVHCIKVHRYSKGIKPAIIEAKILQECDRIDALGAIGIIRTTTHNSKIIAYHPTDPLARNREVDDCKYALDHFFYKLLRLKDAITSKEVKKYAIKRHDFMNYFLNNLEQEVVKNAEPKQASLIIKTIRNYSNLTHYNEENPFLENETIVGKIIKYKNLPLVKDFLNQLRTEIL